MNEHIQPAACRHADRTVTRDCNGTGDRIHQNIDCMHSNEKTAAADGKIDQF